MNKLNGIHFNILILLQAVLKPKLVTPNENEGSNWPKNQNPLHWKVGIANFYILVGRVYDGGILFE